MPEEEQDDPSENSDEEVPFEESDMELGHSKIITFKQRITLNFTFGIKLVEI